MRASETTAPGSSILITDHGPDGKAVGSQRQLGTDPDGSTGPESVPVADEEDSGVNQETSSHDDMDEGDLGIQREEIIGEELESEGVPLGGSALTESEATTAEAEVTDETTREYMGECSTTESSTIPVFRDETRESSRENENSEPTTPPGNLQFSFDYFGTSPGFLDGSELLQMPHELMLREHTTGMRTTSTTE